VSVVDVRVQWQRQVAGAGDMPRAVKAVAMVLSTRLDAHGRGAAPLVDLVAMSTYKRRAVLLALRWLRREGWLHVHAPHRRTASVDDEARGLATVYQATSPALLLRAEVHPGAPQRPVEVHPHAPDRWSEVHPGAPDRGDEVHPGAPQVRDEVHPSAPLFRGEERRGEDPSYLPTTRPLVAATSVAAAVPDHDIDRVLGHLPPHLRPGSSAETARFRLYIAQRIAAGASPQQLVDAALTCTALPRGAAVALWVTHVDRELAAARAGAPIVLPGTRPSKPPWCGECDAATRCVLDEYGLPDARQKCDRCHPHSFGAYVGVS